MENLLYHYHVVLNGQLGIKIVIKKEKEKSKVKPGSRLRTAMARL